VGKIHDILLKYWGYPSFRPLQEEIIDSVLSGKDTLALLPTGGGKSICFQVPALAMEGLCIVITPLIALMKDQVENLKKNGIKAAAIYSGMHRNEIEMNINNCIYGNTKFLYVSPERLETESFRQNLLRMKVSILAVDEAHCISQWGYDFRPPYLKIADIRELLPKVPVLALTATATPEVVVDIQEKLGFNEENVFQKSFVRTNLTYVVINEEDKFRRLLKVVEGVKGTGIVYVRNRRKTREIAEYLNKNNISADYYHAGLENRQREVKQEDWMKGKSRIIVATNAFGMGIDKPDVRFVVHMDFPDSLEAYFQEAGRAGRDEKRAYAVLLYEKADIINAKRNLNLSYPGIQSIKKIYNLLGNWFQIAVGSGKDISYEFDISDFCNNYRLKPLIVFSALKFLEREGYIFLNEAMDLSSKIFINANKEDLYRFQVSNMNYDQFIKILLRSYSGLFSDFVKINEREVAKRTGLSVKEVTQYLIKLQQMEMITYIPQRSKPEIVYSSPRYDIKHISLSVQNYANRKEIARNRMNAVIDYAEKTTKCRSQSLVEYFGETNSKRCGRCDVCIERNKIELSELEFNIILDKIKPILQSKEVSIEELVGLIGDRNEEKVLKAVQWLLDNEKLTRDKKYRLRWNK